MHRITTETPKPPRGGFVKHTRGAPYRQPTAAITRAVISSTVPLPEIFA